MLSPGAVLLPALMAGVVAIAITAAIERWGGRVGGILGTLPTTIVPASLGIAAAVPDAAAFREAMLAVPAGMLLNAAFLGLWRALPPRLPPWSLRGRLLAMVGLSLGSWCLGAVLVVYLGQRWRAWGLDMAVLGLATTGLIVLVGVLACLRPLPSPAGSRRVGPLSMAARGLLAALAIGGAVGVARTGDPLLAGMASVFPAIFLTSMTTLWLAQGEAVPTGAAGPMMLGSASVAVYALLATLAMPALGPGPGAALSWLLAVLGSSLPAGLWLRQRSRRASLAGTRSG